MPNIHLSVPHALGQEEARKRLADLLAQSRAQFGAHISEVTETWTGAVDDFSFRAMGFSVTGKLEAQDAQVLIDIHYPFAALPFKGRVESEILSRAKQLLA